MPSFLPRPTGGDSLDSGQARSFAPPPRRPPLSSASNTHVASSVEMYPRSPPSQIPVSDMAEQLTVADVGSGRSAVIRQTQATLGLPLTVPQPCAAPDVPPPSLEERNEALHSCRPGVALRAAQANAASSTCSNITVSTLPGNGTLDTRSYPREVIYFKR